MAKPDRKEQLAEQLRANLRKRKQQERAREALSADKSKKQPIPEEDDAPAKPGHEDLDED